jgi:hypothetical protein
LVLDDAMKKVIVVIGDIINSRQIKDRYGFQSKLSRDLQRRHLWHAASPYTLTLGDEFQALYTDSRGLLLDLFHLRECIYPVRCRLSLAMGTIETPINKKQAIGMDGPAFHAARKGVEQLRKKGHTFWFEGLPADETDFLLPAITILWSSTDHWNQNRLALLRSLYSESSSAELGMALGISSRAINKNIKDGHLSEWSSFIKAAEAKLSRYLAS